MRLGQVALRKCGNVGGTPVLMWETGAQLLALSLTNEWSRQVYHSLSLPWGEESCALPLKFFSVLNICESHCEIVIFNKWIGNFFQKTIDVSSLGILEIVFLSGT